MNFPFYIARRYIRSKSSQNAVNIINAVTFVVIVIGSAALFIVLSGFSGLKSFSLSFSNTSDPDLKALPLTGKTFALSQEQMKALDTVQGVASYSRELEERVYLTSAQQGVSGITIANLLNLSVQDYRSPLIILAPKPGTGSLSPQGFGDKPYNQLSLVLSGVYQLEENLDKKYVFAELPLVQALLERDSNQVSGLNFKLIPGAQEAELRPKLSEILGPAVQIKNRRELNQTLYRMLNTENVATYLIFTLVLIIALFNVVGAIIMMILDKQQHSRTLYSLGLTVKDLRRIYFVQGILVTSAGGVIGLLIGSLLIASQLAFGWLKITPSLAYPVEYRLTNVLLVLITIVVLGVIASRIASNRIDKKLLSWNA